MKLNIIMDMGVFTQITDSISSSADACILDEVEPLADGLVDGTDITARLNADMELLAGMMEKHHAHSSVILPDALIKVSDSFKVTDDDLTKSLKTEAGRVWESRQ